jgi:hypothetical protein
MVLDMNKMLHVKEKIIFGIIIWYIIDSVFYWSIPGFTFLHVVLIGLPTICFVIVSFWKK